VPNLFFNVAPFGGPSCRGCAIIHPQGYRAFVTQTPAPVNSYLVIGFMGGVEAWNADKHTVRKLALKLRSLDLPNVYVETVENGRETLALQLIQNALDRNRDGKSDDEERASARVILYGHSLGGGSVVKLGSELKEIGVPVLLTIQVDSVGRKDRVIPSNVARAINFYQHDGPFICGRSEIVAEDIRWVRHALANDANRLGPFRSAVLVVRRAKAVNTTGLGRLCQR
jgi:pimeloyl-ACP methyl ester carboxylesterase